MIDVNLRTATLLVLAALLSSSSASPYLEDEMGVDDGEDYDTSLDRFLQPLQDKRSSSGGQVFMPISRPCIRRGGNCDNKQGACCFKSTCRCNLWGANCKCQSQSLLQKWGK